MQATCGAAGNALHSNKGNIVGKNKQVPIVYILSGHPSSPKFQNFCLFGPTHLFSCTNYLSKWVKEHLYIFRFLSPMAVIEPALQSAAEPSLGWCAGIRGAGQAEQPHPHPSLNAAGHPKGRFHKADWKICRRPTRTEMYIPTS